MADLITTRGKAPLSVPTVRVNNFAVVARWDSVAAYMVDGERFDYQFDDRNWYGGLSHKQACERAIAGDPAIAAEATAILAKVEETIAPQTRKAWQDDVYGQRPNVAAYLAGSPYSMRRLVSRPMATRSVNVYVDVSCSGGISATAMIRRGAHILALVEALQASGVQVDAHACMFSRDYGRKVGARCHQIIKLDSPLDLSVSGFVLAHPGFARHVVYGVLQGAFDACSSLGYGASAEDVRRDLNLEPTDVVVPWAALHDETIDNPAAWLKKNLSQILNGEGDAR